MRKRTDAGSSSAALILFLMIASLLSVGLVFSVQAFSGYTARSASIFRIKRELNIKAEEVAVLLTDRQEIHVDSSFDRVFEKIEQLEDGRFKISLVDVSSYLNLNWIRKAVLEEAGILNLETSASDLQQFREDTGIHLDLGRNFGGFFPEDIDLREYFTAYSYFNINLADEFVLRKLYAERTGDTMGAEVFHARIHDYRLETKEQKLIEPEDLAAFLGSDFSLLYPIVNSEPALNVNFAPEPVLLTLLTVCRVKKADSKTKKIVESRAYKPLFAEDIRSIIGEDYQQTPARQYLGPITWFWRLEVWQKESGLIWILARDPAGVNPGDTSSGGRANPPGLLYRLIEERYSL